MKEDLEAYFDRLWPICRSITGNGLRDSLEIIKEICPLETHEVPTGKKVFDWEIPKEWNINDAFIVCPDGKKIAQFKINNLHVLNYSIPVDKKVSYEELKQHIHTLPHMPEIIPYVTSYYNERWGFCLSQIEFDSLPKEGEYHVFIDSSLEHGHLSYGECVLKGESEEEILFSTYLCHPSMAINELSGPLAQAFLYKELARIENRKYTYRFVFAPETIGVIAFLDKMGQHLKSNLKAGYVLTCLGHEGKFTYKRTKLENCDTDRIAEHVLDSLGLEKDVREFSIGGSDERQYCSPGFNFPVGSVMRTMYKEYKEYHTSADNKEIISFEALEQTVKVYTEIAKCFEIQGKYKSTVQYCEPQLGKRGLYPSTGAWMDRQGFRLNLLHFLSFADGNNDLLTIAQKKGEYMLNFSEVIKSCREKGLLE